MAHPDIDTALAWRGRTVRDPGGDAIGALGDVFLDSETQLPAWGGVRTGLFGHRESYVPLEQVQEDGDDLRVPFTADVVKDAPRIDPDVALTAEEEEALWRHYGQEYVLPRGEEEPRQDAARTAPAGDAMTRSEEEVQIGEGPMRPTERVRLRKVLVTDHVQRTVPVRKEVVQLETDPVPEGRIEEVHDVDDETPRSS
jgi:hypothetical protein